MRILVTGAAGFIGAAVCQRLIKEGHEVEGVDCFTPYYDPALKQARLAGLREKKNFSFSEVDITKDGALTSLLKKTGARRVAHLAAQPGVRYSLENPQTYIDNNVTGFLKVLEACRDHKIEHLTYASSSSVYGANRQLPFSEKNTVDHPVSLYAATKRANELMAHTYAHLFQIPVTGLRFFTVYGPWGRPDMVPYKFCLKGLKGEPIEVYNHGNHQRDFTYIDDIAEGVAKVCLVAPAANPGWNALKPTPDSSAAPYRLYNIGNHRPERLEKVIGLIEKAMGKEFKKNELPMQPGDVQETFADTAALKKDFGFEPRTSIEEGIEKFVGWFKDYHRGGSR